MFSEAVDAQKAEMTQQEGVPDAAIESEAITNANRQVKAADCHWSGDTLQTLVSPRTCCTYARKPNRRPTARPSGLWHCGRKCPRQEPGGRIRPEMEITVGEAKTLLTANLATQKKAGMIDYT